MEVLLAAFLELFLENALGGVLEMVMICIVQGLKERNTNKTTNILYFL